jgi:hypothetical protein
MIARPGALRARHPDDEVRITMQCLHRGLHFAAIALAAAAAGCAAPPQQQSALVVMSANALPDDPGLPPPGTTWRLDERELVALSPAPYVPPPPTPIPAPRIAPARAYVPFYAPYSPGYALPWYSGWGIGIGYGFGRVHHTHRAWRGHSRR